MKNVLVTAGAAGIGKAIATCFLDTGANVFVCDIDENALCVLYDEYPRIRGTVTDVGNPEAVQSMVRTAAETMGGIDVLVNNAGIGGPRAAVEEIDIDEWQRTIDVNLNGAFYCIREATPHMKQQNSGVILNIITSSVKVGLPLRSPYVASKAGLIGLSYNLARELGPYNIRSNCISPGLIDNARGRGLVTAHAKSTGISEAEAEQEFLKYFSLNCWIKPEEVGAMAVFLASDEARHITGQHIAVDGNAEWEQ